MLARHGQTDLNKSGVYLGRGDISLNDTGRKQAQKLCDQLAGVRFDAVYTSPLIRCRETACIVAPDYSPIQIDGLMELNFGEWDGRHYEEIQKTDPSAWLSWTENGIDGAPPGGESARAMYERVEKVILDIARRHEKADARVLIIAHGGTLRAIAAWAVGLGAEGMWRFLCEPGSLQKFVIDNGYAYVSLWNQTG